MSTKSSAASGPALNAQRGRYWRATDPSIIRPRELLPHNWKPTQAEVQATADAAS